MLETKSVAFEYESRIGVAGVSLSFPPGKLIGVIGPNGSGKSTLLKLLARVLAPSAGHVHYAGKSLTDWHAKAYAQEVGYLPQEQEVAFPMRALDVVRAGRAPYLSRFGWETTSDFAIADAAIEECDANDLRERFLHQMSGGERKRVHLARVLTGEPSAILLDEPLASLDVAHVDQLSRLLRRIVDKGRTVVVVSHDFNWASAYCDELVLMYRGQLAAQGEPQEVLTERNMTRFFGVDVEIITGSTGRAWLVPALKQ